jgi:hypothetical protein
MPSIAPQSGEFREALASRILVTDGAMGTALYAKGIFINRCYDELNSSLPALIREVHQDYVKAGAEIVETNTFGANRKRLALSATARRFARSMKPACASRERRPAGVLLSPEPWDLWGSGWNPSDPPALKRPAPSFASKLRCSWSPA